MAAEAVPVAGAEAVYAGAGHAASAEVEAAAAVAAVHGCCGYAAPEAEVGADVDAATRDVLGAEVEAAAAEARVWAEADTEAGPGSVPVDTGAGRVAGAEVEPAVAVAVVGAVDVAG